MMLKMYSVFDSKAGAFLPPFFMHTDNVAKRTFYDCANDAAHMFSKHPEDYSLYDLGTFDDASATLVTKVPPVNLGLASQYKMGYIAGSDTTIDRVNPGG